MMTAPRRDVLLHTGEHVPLNSLYEMNPLVLVFLRHLGCVFCKDQVAQLKLSRRLGEVVLVSMGDLEQTRHFREKHRSPHTFISDPDRVLYQAFELGRGTGKQVFCTKTFAKGIGATLRGHWVGQPVGDIWQMPGVFLIDTDGNIVWEYRSVHAADNPPNSLIEQQLGRL